MAELSGWDIAVVFAKAIAYAATLGSAGSIFFLAYSRPLLRDIDSLRIERGTLLLLIAAAIASVITIPLLAGSMSGDLSGMFDRSLAGMILHAGQGRATEIRIAGLALAVFAVSGRRRFQVPAMLGAIAAATSFSWVGHVHALLPNIVPSLFLGLHLLCAAFWLGALMPLLMLGEGSSAAQIAAVAARFGRLALAVVALLIIAGFGLLWTLIADASIFWSSGYGRLVALKLVTVAVLLCAAALNKLYLTPKLLNGDAGAARLFRRSLKAEMILGGLILLITAAFTTVTGPP
jgi:copper resistance protein D